MYLYVHVGDTGGADSACSGAFAYQGDTSQGIETTSIVKGVQLEAWSDLNLHVFELSFSTHSQL